MRSAKQPELVTAGEGEAAADWWETVVTEMELLPRRLLMEPVIEELAVAALEVTEDVLFILPLVATSCIGDVLDVCRTAKEDAETDFATPVPLEIMVSTELDKAVDTMLLLADTLDLNVLGDEDDKTAPAELDFKVDVALCKLLGTTEDLVPLAEETLALTAGET